MLQIVLLLLRKLSFIMHKKQLFFGAITNIITAQATPVDSDMSF